jgi:hypothetical protein
MSLEWLAYDAVNTFLTNFAESITYSPADGEPVTIPAIIYRNPATTIAGLTGSTVYAHEIEIANSTWNGVTSINRSVDTVTFASVIGGTAEAFIVREIISNDEGMWRLGVG